MKKKRIEKKFDDNDGHSNEQQQQQQQNAFEGFILMLSLIIVQEREGERKILKFQKKWYKKNILIEKMK